ncbi:hypothetical protein SKAU_G00201270 [Synaphobranchus kaupii]|uniref:Leucine-rich repeat-containing protein 15 n=1 Tax=Synaphobranchus kaupii TaxID=118154 RepID=A0A9Q1FFJ7_SYNKA|nr:hypothetical protein SKAU_G00201270 [Synaphobranchus kaupii]
MEQRYKLQSVFKPNHRVNTREHMDWAVYLFLLYSMCAVSAVQGNCPVECHCEKLNQVQCQGEMITAFPSPIPPNTTYIYIAHTNISSLKPSDFESCAKTLKNVNISYSGITEILDGTFNNTHGLAVLSLTGTKLKGLPGHLFKNLGGLQRLLLDRNNITALSRETFRGLSQLYSLDLSQNALSTIPEGSFDDLQNLVQLSLYHNHIDRLPAQLFSRLHKLKELYLSRNCLSVLPIGIFSKLVALSKLSLFGNCLETLSVGVFGRMPLQKLWLHDNKLNRLEGDVFQNLTQLRLLVLNRNRIGSVSVHAFRGLGALGELSLHTNMLDSLEEGTFSGLTSLVNISLEHNHLRSLPGNLLHGLASLKRLDIHNNSLPNLPRELLASLDSVDEVLLSQNPWQCDQDIVPLRDWLRVHSSKVQNFSGMVCHLPVSLSGINIATFNDPDWQPAATLHGVEKDIVVITVALVCTLIITVLLGIIFFWRRRE